MPIIDAHNHVWENSSDWPARLIAVCDENHVDMVVLAGLPAEFGFSSNKLVYSAMKKFPDRIIGFAWIDLGKDPPDSVDNFRDAGFRGLKFHIPRVPYDHQRVFSIYERAEQLDMPCLFHTGIVMSLKMQPKDYIVSNENMRPIRLDTIGRSFPKLRIIGAHFGNPWADEASMVCRVNPNIFFDLSGSTLKWRSLEEMARLLWWRADYWGGVNKMGAWEKIVFGSDYGLKIEGTLNDYKRLLEYCRVSPKEQRLVFGETMQKLLKLQ